MRFLPVVTSIFFSKRALQWYPFLLLNSRVAVTIKGLFSSLLNFPFGNGQTNGWPVCMRKFLQSSHWGIVYIKQLLWAGYYLCNRSLTGFSLVPSPRRRCYKRYFTLRLHIHDILEIPWNIQGVLTIFDSTKKKFGACRGLQNCGKLPTGIINNQFVLLRACGTQI